MTSMSNTARLGSRASNGLLDKVTGTIALWIQRSASREQLARMDLRLAEDIGLTPGDVMREVNKPFWRA